MFQNIVTYAREWFRVNKWQAITLVALALVVGMAIGAPTADAAESATVTCTPVTQNTDGSAITGAVSYKAYFGTSATALSATKDLGATCGGVVSGLPSAAPGASITYYFAVTASVAGVESAKSNIASKAFSTALPVPKPPTGLTAVETTAYNVDWKWTRKGFLVGVGRPLGTVEIGTACHDDFNVAGGYARVDRKDVTSTQRVLPAIVLAKCAKA